MLEKYKDSIFVDEQNIKGFFGTYRCFSNFHLCPVNYNSLLFPSSEHAYMYAKLENDPDLKAYNHVITLTAIEVKQWGRTISLRPNWDNIKFKIMEEIVRDKFTRNKDIQQTLLDTDNKYLEESNWWKDAIWGYDIINNKGKNMLGIILMKIRNELRMKIILDE